MAIKFCGKSSLSMYVVLAVFIVAWTVNINLGQEIAFEIQGDVIIFEGDSLTIACTYSIKNEFSVFIALHGERTPVFTLTNITNATHIGNIGFITPSIGDETFVCMSKEFLCSSKPTSIITWEVRNQNANVEFLINGPLISTIVPSNSTFTGDVNITCFGIFEHYEASRVVNIRVLANDQNILYFVIGGSALLTVIVIFLIFLVCYLKRRKAVKNDEAETGIDLTPSVPATKAPGNFHNPAMTIGFGKESGETGAMQMDEPPPYSIVNKVIAKSKIQSDESRSYDHNTNPRPESSAYYTISAGSEGKHAVKCSGEPEGSKKEEDMVKRRITIHEDLIEGDDWSDSEDGDNFDSSLH
ncbi:hypothetical protein HOLleu_41928 [Holothuria leucospilota]|uniref:Uncharacterized protein n=1 Tax=Holothuria leucospilota TaxID=206669 RepID=A0A9Q0YH32_HOLLE|nr:hypothetical protein HOLleu_41928 [Holothuria leucospilota]